MLADDRRRRVVVVELSTGVVGAGLVLIGVALLVLEAHLPGWGGPGALGLVCVVAGVLIALDSAQVLDMPRSLVVALLVIGAIFVPVATVLMIRVRRVPTFIPPTLVGTDGVAITDLDPNGTVRVRSEEWSAESAGERIEAGAKVTVVGEDGLKLRVDRR
jgi:membrane-bound serine protease (ClpP class)